MENKDKNTCITRKDLWWIISILIAIIITILAIRLSDNRDVVNIISFMSSGISIVLALVAMGYAIYQSSQSEKQNAITTETLGEIKLEIKTVVEMKKELIDIQNESKLQFQNNINQLSNILNSTKGIKIDGNNIKDDDESYQKVVNELNDKIEILKQQQIEHQDKVNNIVSENKINDDKNSTIINNFKFNNYKDLNIIRDFKDLSNDFKSGKFDLNTVSNIIFNIRTHRNKLTKDEVKLLLEVPINILENDCKLKNKDVWSKDNAMYFAGNITWVNSSYFNDLKLKFNSGDFELSDIINLAKKVRDNFDELSSASEFLLRNVEVTIRDDVEIYSYSKFNSSGEIFAEYIDKAMEI